MLISNGGHTQTVIGLVVGVERTNVGNVEIDNIHSNESVSIKAI